MDMRSEALEAPRRPVADSPAEAWLYVRSVLRMRIWVGVIGLALPIVLLVGDELFIDGNASARGSLSAYYHSGVRDFFVGVLCATGVFLICYRVAERTWDNILSTVAGAAAVLVAIFPTGLPEIRSAELVPIQVTLGEDFVSLVHGVSAAIFIGCLGIMSYLFGVREGKKIRSNDQRLSPKAWRGIHLLCAGAIALAGAFIAVTKLFSIWDDYSLLIGESVSVLAFGVSWLVKGADAKYLRQRPDSSAPGSPRQTSAVEDAMR